MTDAVSDSGLLIARVLDGAGGGRALDWKKSGRSLTQWGSGSGFPHASFASHVTAVGGGQVAGDFEAVVRRFNGTAAPLELHMEGTFLVNATPRLR